MKLSPEYCDPLKMEIWYKSIGDDYALYIIEENKKRDAQIQEMLDELPNSVELNKTLEYFRDWLHNHSDFKKEEDFKKVDELAEYLSLNIDEIEAKLDKVYEAGQH